MLVLISDSGKVRRTSERLLFVEQEIIRNSRCSQLHDGDKDLITPDVICTRSINLAPGNCIGDAGSALIISDGSGKDILIGFLSFVRDDGSCDPKSPAVFTRITSHFKWITQVTGYQFRF